MSSDATTSPSRPGEQRLHPWSWLFVLAQNLKQFLVPLLALLLFGGGRNEGFQLAAAGVAMVVLVAISLLEYLTYRYRVGEDLLTVRSGWLERKLREIPFARIHNIVVHQSLLHRLFGVAELRLESAGSAKPEAQMRVLRLDDALALEARVRQRGQAMPATGERDGASATPVPARQLLLALPPAEIVRLGLISNRGMIVFAAALGAAWQVLPDRWVANAFERSGRQLYGYAEHLQPDRLHSALGAAAIVLLALALLRLLSILLAFVQYHGFRLDESQKRLTVERGLFTRVRTSVAQRRIQAWTLHEGLLHRLFRRRSLHVDTAAAQADETQARALRDLAPVIVPEHGDALVRHLLPQRTWPPAQWQPIQGSGWRLFWPGALVSLALAAGLAWRFQAGWTALPLLWWPWGALSAWQQVRRLGYSVEDGLVAVRGGWFKRWWRFADLDKVQALRLSRSPLDLRCGTATLWLDTAGAGGFEPPLCIPYLPHATAQELLATLGKRLSRQRLCW